MKITPSSEVTSDERLMSALAHFSILLPVVGIILPVVIWLTQREKSTFVRFQSLQALVFQLFQMVYQILVSIAVSLLGFILIMVFSVAGAVYLEEDSFLLVMLVVQFAFIGLYFLAFSLYILVGIAGAILIISKKDFRYPIFGGWLQRFLEADPNMEETL